ncbi:carbohydrate ABC transporter permease [Oryzihumus sp.]|uniref:carbohydrate ABC transporter permease n=1 Tax=Oryzihumus sp. TaxID=1968903 RepID=UPI002ED8C60C
MGRRHTQPAMILPRPVHLACTAVMVAVAAAPVAFLLLVSVMPDAESVSGRLWPSRLAVGNYVRLWTTVPMAQGLANSLVVALGAAVLATLAAVGTAYCLVRFTFVGRLVLLRSLVGFQALPGTMLILPLFVVFSSAQAFLGVQLVGSRVGLVVTYLTFSLPFATWVMVVHLRKIPVALEEAARIDGASRLGALLRVILPLSVPGMAVATTFCFLNGWNDVVFSSILTQPETRTAAIELQVFAQSQEGGALPLYGQLMAASVVCAAPVVLLSVIFQRQLVGGLATDGVKG